MRAKSEDGQFRRRQKSPKINWLPWQRLLDYCENYGSLIICMHASTKAETLVKIGSVVVEIFGDISQFRLSHSTIFIFHPTLTQKLLNRFSPFFTRCRAISRAINACIHMTIVHPVSKWNGAERRAFRKFYPKLVAMATSLEISKKELQIYHLHPKCFHSVKRLWKSVQRILNASMPNERISYNFGTRFIFYPGLTQKLLNRFSPSFYTI